MWQQSAWLFLVHAQLSVAAVGGVVSVLPEMQRQLVEVHGWVTPAEFADLFALAQAAPGPNMLVVTAVGWHVAGWVGALAATLGLIGPPALMTFLASSLLRRYRDAPWRRAVQAGLVPVTVGLVLASATLLTVSTTTGWLAAATTAVTAALLLGTRVHPLVVLAAGAGLAALAG